jgi:hypothetical protein
MSALIRKQKFDNLWLGIAIGFIAPIITLAIYISEVYPNQFREMLFDHMLVFFIVPKIISLAVLPNLAFFMLFIYTNRYLTSKGILGATIVFAVVVFILKIVA